MSRYQKLFDYFYQEHNIILLEQEMQEVINFVNEMQERDRIAGELSGSGVNIPLNLTIWKKAQSMNYSDFAKWFNEELKNNTLPTK